jgi:hypothetical protein
MTMVTVGPDIAKQIFQVHGVNRSGKTDWTEHKE